jgi:hypothetical protein
MGKTPPFWPAPIAFHYALAYVAERIMPIPLVAMAQVRILREGVVEAVLAPDRLPDDLVPSTPFDAITVRAGLPEPGPFGWGDVKWMPRHGSKGTKDQSAFGRFLVEEHRGAVKRCRQ